MKYLKKFETHTEYETYKDSEDYLTPNVSYCVDRNDVHFEKYFIDYPKEYLTFYAMEDTEFSIVFEKGLQSKTKLYITRAMRESFSYSIDDGETWVTFETPNDTYSGIALTTPTIHAGEKVLWKGIGTQNFVHGTSHAYCHFTSSGRFIAYGNMMSIIYGDMFIDKNDLENNHILSCFFYNNTYLISAQNLILSATTLADNCYNNMFSGCTSLTTAPELPATTMVLGCYNGMFIDCTSLTTAPELPSTILAERCYGSMFSGCTSLATAPELPATTLTGNCYYNMFKGCASLTTAPELPATTLTDNCYVGMFNGCSNLNYIKAMFTTTPSTSYTNSWVNGVAASGTFVKNSAATWNVTGNSGIPSGWTVETASA